MKRFHMFKQTVSAEKALSFNIILFFVFLFACVLAGCGMVNLGKWKGIETSAADEHYYLVKDAYMSPGSLIGAKDNFDHNIHSSVLLCFTPRNEPNHYTAESVWYDPSDVEYRKIRETYDSQKESKKGMSRNPKGTMRVMSLPTQELYDHKPGLWKVELFLDGKLARRLNFTVR
ncbi:MAG: hypothetical protein ACP5U1_10930 [Desulfomonilaceae bacterium]